MPQVRATRVEYRLACRRRGHQQWKDLAATVWQRLEKVAREARAGKRLELGQGQEVMGEWERKDEGGRQQRSPKQDEALEESHPPSQLPLKKDSRPNG